MVAKTFGAALQGVEAVPITLEVSVGQGLHTFLVGLPDNVVKESLIRIEVAIKSSGLHMPRTKIVINLAPADLQKTGAAFDLPLALGILAASGQIENSNLLNEYMIAGELGLDGSIQSIRGVLPMAILARNKKLKGLIIPNHNQCEAALVNNLNIYGMATLKEAVEFFNQGCLAKETSLINTREIFSDTSLEFAEDFADVKGQDNMKRVLEIAAAGGHNVIFIGPPGSSKTMLARRMTTILPPLSLQEALETTRIYSVAGKLPDQVGLIAHRPFRSPHHTTSDIALTGGGSVPQPGEISLAHNGILFMDELPEFKRAALEVLRQPLEEKKITVSRAKMTLLFPASFMLIASMNPCPCGYYNHPERKCTCSPLMVKKYMARISGPLLDRIDLQLKVSPVAFTDLDRPSVGETSTVIRKRVIHARTIQAKRNITEHGYTINAHLTGKQIEKYCALNDGCKKFLHKSMQTLQLSARAYERILKVCRTIADLSGNEAIRIEHVAEAVHYRNLDVQHDPMDLEANVRKFEELSDETRMYLRRIL